MGRALLGAGLAALVGCNLASAPSREGARPDVRLTVYAAASLTEAFTELGEAFEQGRPGVEVAFNFAGSQQLAQQIIQGAPADVFASADEGQMAQVEQAGRLAGPARVFAHNRLVVALPGDNPAGLRALPDLARPGLKLVLAAPEVPAGRYARLFLEQAGRDPDLGASYGPAVMENVVSYEENVRAVLSKVVLGEADAGLVYLSDLDGYGPNEVVLLEIPSALNVQASYPIAVMAGAREVELAEAFLELVFSAGGQEILSGRGFLPAGAATGP